MRRRIFLSVALFTAGLSLLACSDAGGEEDEDCSSHETRSECVENDCHWNVHSVCPSYHGAAAGSCDDHESSEGGASCYVDIGPFPDAGETDAEQDSPDSSVDSEDAVPGDGDAEGGGSDAGDGDGDADAGRCDTGETWLEDACLQCAPDGGCATSESRCVPTCGPDDDCADDPRDVPTSCQNGVCRSTCL